MPSADVSVLLAGRRPPRRTDQRAARRSDLWVPLLSRGTHHQQLALQEGTDRSEAEKSVLAASIGRLQYYRIWITGDTQTDHHRKCRLPNAHEQNIPGNYRQPTHTPQSGSLVTVDVDLCPKLSRSHSPFPGHEIHGRHHNKTYIERVSNKVGFIVPMATTTRTRLRRNPQYTPTLSLES